jgi:HrpA-like RNA helicase
VKYVVDTGYVKTRLINTQTGIEMLKVLPVSKSQANQRSGRAGRECAGKCFRLFTEDTFEFLEEVSAPEIQRMNISQVLLQLKMLGVKSVSSFPFISTPSEIVLRKGLETLLLLGALDKASSSLCEYFDYALLSCEHCQILPIHTDSRIDCSWAKDVFLAIVSEFCPSVAQIC